MSGLPQIEAQIRQRLGGLLSDLQVTIQGDGVVLRGRTLTLHAKQVVLQVVLDMTDLPIRSNEIRVETRSQPNEPRAIVSPSEPRRDEVLAERFRGETTEPAGEPGLHSSRVWAPDGSATERGAI